jgi:DNA-binding GntR family transcriptional regulator
MQKFRMAQVIELARGALHDQVTQRLRTLLVEGRLAPGAKLNERELAQALNVSRTPLREAIKHLAAEGLVDLVPNRGAVAVKLGADDVAHAFEVLAALEALAGELAAARATDSEIAEIRALHFEMLACHARQDLSGYYRLNARIHAALNAAARNPVLTQQFATLNARVQALRFRTNQDASKWRRAVQEHGRMIDALEARDGAALRSVLLTHLHHKRDAVLQLLHDGQAYPEPRMPQRRR